MVNLWGLSDDPGRRPMENRADKQEEGRHYEQAQETLFQVSQEEMQGLSRTKKKK